MPDRALFQAADIYAFAITLYELLVRRNPWPAVKQAAILEEMVCEQGLRPDCTELDRDLDKKPAWFQALAEVMKRCWHQDAHQRPVAAELSTELQALFRDYWDPQQGEQIGRLHDGNSLLQISE